MHNTDQVSTLLEKIKPGQINHLTGLYLFMSKFFCEHSCSVLDMSTIYLYHHFQSLLLDLYRTVLSYSLHHTYVLCTRHTP